MKSASVRSRASARISYTLSVSDERKRIQTSTHLHYTLDELPLHLREIKLGAYPIAIAPFPKIDCRFQAFDESLGYTAQLEV